jgi:hypothetical protein
LLLTALTSTLRGSVGRPLCHSRSTIAQCPFPSYLQLPNRPLRCVGGSQASTDALRRFAAASEGCRRREILSFFGEVPPFQQCGTCDLCLAQQHHTGDMTRDFRDEATLLLLSVDALTTSFKSPAMTAIKGLALQGKWPIPGPSQNEVITQRLKALRDRIKPERRSEEFLKAST